jgi:diaminopimelate decarboxylase
MDVNTTKTPYYLYDFQILNETLNALQRATVKYGVIPHYAVKANCESEILSTIAARGVGADCVSIYEVRAALACGFKVDGLVFSGAGKRPDEIREAIELGIGCLNIESLQELFLAGKIAAELRIPVRFSLRITPDAEVETHEYLTTGRSFNKFGLLEDEIDEAITYIKTAAFLRFTGIHLHAGSQIRSTNTFRNLSAVMQRFNELFIKRGLVPVMLNLGGGWGINYDEPDVELIPDFDAWFSALNENIKLMPGQKIHVEPGRSVVAQCGSLVTEVLYTKERGGKIFAIVDAGMTELLRPALYGSKHKVHLQDNCDDTEEALYDVVGPICESSDVFAQALRLPVLEPGTRLVIRSVGAYGQTMSSRYNMRPEAPVVFINHTPRNIIRENKGSQFHCVCTTSLKRANTIKNENVLAGLVFS